MNSWFSDGLNHETKRKLSFFRLTGNVDNRAEYVKMKEMERIYSKLKKAYDTAKEIGDTSKAEELKKRINELKRTFILEMEQDERK